MFTVIKLEHRHADNRVDDEYMMVVGYDIGETYICRVCAIHGFHSSLAICFSVGNHVEDVRILSADRIVGEMDSRETYKDVPECGNCGTKLIDARAYRLALKAYK
jgi:hypothetical protein